MSNKTITTLQKPMMSSKEIAKLTGKRPADVIRDIWMMLESLYDINKDNADLRHLKNQQVTITNDVIAIIDNRGYVSEFFLDRRHSEILITGYDVKRRAAVIDRWFVLETGAAKPTAISRKELALMVIEAEDRAEAAALENKTLSTAVESLEKHFTKGMTLPAFGKALNGVNTSKITWWAFERGWLYNEQSDPEREPRWRVKSYARDKYLTEEDIQIKDVGKEPFTKKKIVLLQKGTHRVYQLYLKGELPMKATWNGEFSHNKAIYTPEAK